MNTTDEITRQQHERIVRLGVGVAELKAMLAQALETLRSIPRKDVD